MPEALAKLESQTSDAVMQAERMEIVCDADYQNVGLFTRGLSALKKKIKDTFRPIITKAHAAHKEAVKQEKDALAPVLAAEQIVGRKMIAYDQLQEAKAKEEEARLAEEARKAEEDARIREAAALEAEGDKEAAEEVLNEPVETPVVKVKKEKPPEGISYRTTWSAEVRDMKALVKYVAENPQFINLLQVNTTALNSMARSLKGNMKVPGVKAVGKKGIAKRG
jgi:hypothetical protein